jgi:hypothetical protein
MAAPPSTSTILHAKMQSNVSLNNESAYDFTRQLINELQPLRKAKANGEEENDD